MFGSISSQPQCDRPIAIIIHPFDPFESKYTMSAFLFERLRCAFRVHVGVILTSHFILSFWRRHFAQNIFGVNAKATTHQLLANKNSQSTTALNHCVDCNCLSSPAASPSVSWRAAEARFYSWRTLESGHKHFFIHTRAILAIGISFVISNAIVRVKVVMSIFLKDEFWVDLPVLQGVLGVVAATT